MYRQKQQRSMTLTVAAVAALAPLAAACGSEKADDGGSASVGAGGERITGVRWSIDSVTVDGATHRAPDTAHVRIDDGGEAAGSTGCNSFSARADVDGERVRLSDAMFTEEGPRADEPPPASRSPSAAPSPPARSPPQNEGERHRHLEARRLPWRTSPSTA
ncbi:META domain-containing protein OS=Streptomyces tendae OX=1932 GN=GUR47_22010 PE=4 SV=1 [Streptomyces tendae]